MLKRSMQFPIFSLLTTIVICGAILFLLYLQPFALAHIIAEDNLGQYGTAICHLIAAVTLLFMATRSLPLSTRIVCVVLAAAAIFIAGEEISWGMRMFPYSVPESIARINVQREMTIHNMELVLRIASPTKIVSYIIIVWSAISLLIQMLARSHFHTLASRGMPFLPASLIPLFMLVPLFILTPRITNYEIAELLFSIAVMFWSFWFATRHSAEHIGINGSSIFLAVIALWFLPVLLAFIVTDSFGRELSLKHYLNQLANPGPGKLLRNLPDQSMSVYRYILSNPRYMTLETRVNFAGLLIAMNEHCKARQQLEMAATQIHESHEKQGPRPSTLRLLGSVYLQLDRAAPAHAAFQQAISVDRQLIEATDDPNTLVRVLWSLSDTMEYMGRLQEAHALAEKARMVATDAKERWRSERRLRLLKREIRISERKAREKPGTIDVDTAKVECTEIN